VANLPLLAPPAVLVYYLVAGLGRWPLHFSWPAAVGVSAIYTLPLLLRMMRAALAAVDHSVENAARGLGAGEWRTFRLIALPLAWRALGGAVLAGFARAFVDFGATAVVAGSGGLAWFLPIAAVGLASLYIGNRLRRGQVLA
jgi:molybdate transport system permease protein